MADPLPNISSSCRLDVAFSPSQVPMMRKASGRAGSSQAPATPSGLNSRGVVFRSAPAGMLFEDRTGSPLGSSDRADIDRSRSIASVKSSGSITRTSKEVASCNLRASSFELVSSCWDENDGGGDMSSTSSVQEASDRRAGTLAHLSGSFSMVSPDHIRASAFRKSSKDAESKRSRPHGVLAAPDRQDRANDTSRQQTVTEQASSLRERSGSANRIALPGRQDKTASQSHSEETGKARAEMRAQRPGGVMEQLFCGAFAGVISRTAVAPIDLVRTHLISSHGLEGANITAVSVLKSIVKRDGLVGLFRGNGVNCLRVAPNKAIELCTFQMLKRTFCVPGHPLQHIAAPLSGGAAGMAGTIATYPLEVMRTRISLQPERYTSLASTFLTMVKEEGFGSMYRGLPISLFGVFPYAATNYFVYDALRGLYRRTTGRDKVPTGATLIFGALAASVSSAVTFPLEVARRRLQLGAVGGAAAPTSGLQVVQQICQKEGWRAVYRGLGTTWLKLIPAAGISFVCYEAARYALRVDDASVAAGAAAAKAEEVSAKARGAAGVETGSVKGGLDIEARSSAAGSGSGRPVRPARALRDKSKTQPLLLATRSASTPERGSPTSPLKATDQSSEPGQTLESYDPESSEDSVPSPLDVGMVSSLKEWKEIPDYLPLPSPFGVGPTMVTAREGLVQSEDLQLLKKSET